MTPMSAQILFSCAISFVLGGIAGMFGVRTLYGVTENIAPNTPPTLECPPPSCPPCRTSATEDTDLWGDTPEPWSGNDQAEGSERSALPGLPASAIQAARLAVEANIATCPKTGADPYQDNHVMLLHLTIATANGEGYIREAWVYPGANADAEIADCLSKEALRARFEWTGADGEITFKLPVSLEPHL